MFTNLKWGANAGSGDIAEIQITQKYHFAVIMFTNTFSLLELEGC